MSRQYSLAAFLICAAASTSAAHYNMLLPASPSAMKGDEVVFIYQFGHPYEHELLDAPKPAKVNVLFPDGETHKDLTASLEAFKQVGAADKRITSWRFKFTPQQRGDHTFFLATPPIWLEADTRIEGYNYRVWNHWRRSF